MKRLLSVIFLSLLLISPQQASADSALPAVSIINPLRGPQLGLEHANLAESLQSQWEATKKAGIQATWLWQYSALEDPKMVSIAQSQMKGQEFGVFLEIDRNLAEKAGVGYKGSSSWYFSDGLLLVSYDLFEREKLIRTVFEKFKATFGYYPKTVGAWWVGAQSIDFMQKTYGITGVLQCSDQFGTDAYSIWGTPWSIPYRPSSTNAAIPAPSLQKSEPVVIMQWAPRDPTRAYGKDVAFSTFSLQDYPSKGYDENYIDYLTSIYLKQPYDQLVFGLEGGLPSQSYTGTYEQQLLHLKQLRDHKVFSLESVSNYSQSFLSSQQVLPPTNSFLATDYANSDQSFWITTPAYRVGVLKQGEKISLMDLRDYLHTVPEDFYRLPNSDRLLRITTQALVDSVRSPGTAVTLANSTEPLRIAKVNDTVFLNSGGKVVGEFAPSAYTFPTLPPGRTFLSPLQPSPLVSWLLTQSIWWLGGVIVLYFVILVSHKLSWRFMAYAGILLAASFLICAPYFSSWNIPDGSILFSHQAFPILRLVSQLPLSPSSKLLLGLQFLPFALILILNYLAILLARKHTIFWYIYLLLLFLLLLVSTPLLSSLLGLTTAGKKGWLLFMSLVGLGSLVWIMVFWAAVQRRFIRITTCLLLILLAGCLFFVSSSLLEEKRVIITPFELEALETFSTQPAILLQPLASSSYRAVTPLLLIDPRLFAQLATSHWKVSQDISSQAQGLIVTPVHLQRGIPPEQIEGYQLKKLFDNAQIQVYQKNP